MKTTVTDGHMLRLAIKQHELFERMKKDVYDSPDEVLEALQLVIEGKVPTIPTLAVVEKFAAWRTFLIGGVAPKKLLERVKAGFSVSEYAEYLMKQKAFTMLDAEEALDAIILTPKDFDYERMPTTTELFDPTRLAEWSRQNANRLPEGCVVELLPAEAGPHIRDQYKDQPKGEVLWMAMERIADSGGHPSVFGVERYDDGTRWLDVGDASPAGRWDLAVRIVFRLRKVTQA